MTQEQLIHIGMVNSFNIITGRNKFEEIIMSDVNILAHSPDEEIDFYSLETMIDYFLALEMFEKCVELTLIMEELFTPDGRPRQERCECSTPEIGAYSRMMFCSACKKRIKK